MRRRLLLTNNNIKQELQLITFTVNNIESIAEKGMTWREWILSDYFDDSNPYGICVIVGSEGSAIIKEHANTIKENLGIFMSSGIPFVPYISLDDVIDEISYVVESEDWT